MSNLPAFSASELFLVGLWFVVGFWNSSVGPTGGVIFATMASLLPPTVVVPLQAVVEAGSGLLRTWLMRAFVDWRFILLFAASSVFGFAAGLTLRRFAPPSEDALRLIMGTSILVTLWVPMAKTLAANRVFPWLVGSGTAFAGLFTTGIGPFIASAIASDHDDHREVVATISASLIYQHGVKVIIFGALGFSFGRYADLLFAMLAAALAGAWLGARVVLRVRQGLVAPVFKWCVTLLALKLLYEGLGL